MLSKSFVCRPEISPKYYDKFKSELCPNLAQTPEKPGPTYKSG